MDQGGREEIRHEVQMGQTERDPRAPQQRRSPQVRRRARVGGDRERTGSVLARLTCQRNAHPEDVREVGRVKGHHGGR